LEGWAAVVGDSSTSGTWDKADSEDIALLEMKAVLLGLQAFFEQPPPLTIHLSTDNTVTKAFVNHMGAGLDVTMRWPAVFGLSLRHAGCFWSPFTSLQLIIVPMNLRASASRVALIVSLPPSSNSFRGGSD
jgi:hypothetical protein